MKISILTFSKEFNYGANLQCYALSKVLQDMGCEVQIIDAQLQPIKASLVTRIIRYPSERAFKKFQSKWLPPFTCKYNTLEDLKNNPPKSDVFIVGSDQVWNPDVTNRFDSMAYFFPFVPDDKTKLSYAASIGVSEWKHKELTEQIKGELQKFKAISVRETSGGQLLKTTFGIDSQVVLDPTLLLSSYDQICGEYDAGQRTKNLVLFKFVKDSKCDNVCLKIANEYGLKAVHLTNRRKVKGFSYCPNASVKQWLNTIRYADFVVTDSFHCTAFCILFHKQFIVLPSFPNRAGRMQSLLSQLGLSDRFCNTIEEFNHNREKLYNSIIDYNIVGNNLNTLRLDSMNFLTKNIL